MKLALDPVADQILATVRTPRTDGFIPEAARPDPRFGRFSPDGTPRISPSQVNTLRMCPARWKHQYLEGRPDQSSWQAIAGSIAHAAMEAALVTVDDPIGPRALEASTRFAADVHLGDPATIAGTSNGAAIDVLAVSAHLARAVRDTWNWLSHFDVEVLGVEERVVGRYDGAVDRDHRAIDVDSLSFVDARLVIDGVPRVIDWKFPGRAPWQTNGRVEARDSYLLAMQMYGDAYDRAGLEADEAWIVHASLDGNGVAVAKEQYSHDSISASREKVHGAIDLILGGNLEPDPVTPGALCSATWCSYYAECPAT